MPAFRHDDLSDFDRDAALGHAEQSQQFGDAQRCLEAARFAIQIQLHAHSVALQCASDTGAVVKIAILSRRPGVYGNRRLLAAAAARGWQAEVVDPLAEPADAALDRFAGFDAVLPRYSPYWQAQAHVVLMRLQRRGMPSLNDAAAIAMARDLPASLQALTAAGLAMPESVCIDAATADSDWLARLPFGLPVVCKRGGSSQGRGVALYRNLPELVADVRAMLARREAFLLQEFIAEARGRDLRLLVIGGRVAASMQRIARPGEFRANVHLGARAGAWVPSAVESGLAIAAAAAMGLRVAGVDIIRARRGPLLLEVNASPGFEALEKVSGRDLAGKLLDSLAAA